MADWNRTDDEGLTEAVAAVIDRLTARRVEVIGKIQRTLMAEIAELWGDAALLELQAASVVANVDTVFDVLHYEIPIDRVEPPTAALEYARRVARRGVPANAVIRAYRLGQQVLLELVLDEIRAAEVAPTLALDVCERITQVSFGYIDWISQQVLATYETEHALWLENRNTLRAERVRELLVGGDVDIDAVADAIRYPLREQHLALILWYPEDTSTGSELVRLERFLRELSETLGAQDNPLFVAADRLSGWGWIPLAAAAGADARMRRFLAAHPDTPFVAVGTPQRGADGFRHSHQQAQSAFRVATAALPTPRLTSASDPGTITAALLGADLPQTRLWVLDTLGGLAADTGKDARLRETLRVYLRENASYKSAADQLNLHYNSVKYRVQRAIDRRGRPITDDGLDVELALLACERFGAAVLAPADQSPNVPPSRGQL
ncbi:PucR family transcriptional regulator [Nocardia sp. NPDC101769]|uniref:PucR family transcriptional regulator n=1 Tax=Nocardia sp. NPDC101769 TaxID=3364333 RepID=UPI0037FA284F